MNVRLYRLMAPLAVLAVAAGCSNASTNPLTPATPAGSDSGGASTPAATASIGAPRPVQPANGAVIKNADQPITLVVKNALVTKAGAAATYTVEVATDPTFGTKVQTKDNVTEGAGGQTSVRLDLLPAATDYYWHARATGGGTTGVFGAIFKFSIGPAIIINAPVPITPLTGSQTSQRPALRVTNAVKSGPAGLISYRFEVSTSGAFTSLVTAGTNAEGVNETGFIPTADLPLNVTLFWRATAIDLANGIASPPSVVQSFTTSQPSQAELVAAQLGVPLWPGAQPPGSTGHAVMGARWTVEPLVSFNGVPFMNPPLEELQIFDLLDRGLNPDAAIDWMKSNGYPTTAVNYPSVAVIGFPYEYLAFVNGQWDIVIRVGG